MKTIKVNQTILFGILGFLFLSIITHYLIHNLDNKKTTEIQVKAFDIDEKTRQINDKLDGLSRVWLEDGTLISESEYSNGQPHGIWMQYHPNGSMKYEVYYEYGKKNGDEKWFYKNGQIKSKHQFIRGKPATEIIRWKPDGTLVY